MLGEKPVTLVRDVHESHKDENIYSMGSITEHNEVIACLPSDRIGNNPVAAVAAQMREKTMERRHLVHSFRHWWLFATSGVTLLVTLKSSAPPRNIARIHVEHIEISSQPSRLAKSFVLPGRKCVCASNPNYFPLSAHCRVVSH